MNSNTPANPSGFRPASSTVPLWAARIAVHTTGVFGIAVILLFVMIPPSTASLVARQLMEVPELSNGLYLRTLIHLACSAAVWTLLFASFKVLWNIRSSGQKTLNVVRLKATAGAILVETLIVLPVLLMFIFGLSQFAINNIAAVLARYAAYSGARTVWIWQPESNANRKNINDDNVSERARIAVALAMTPIAPGDFINVQANTSPELEAIRLAMYNRFATPISAPLNLAQSDPRLEILATANNKSYTGALDTSSFSTRAVRKLTHAYLSVEVPPTGITYENGRVGVRFTYWHHQSMPVVSKIFGELTTKGGRTGYYAPIPIEYSFPIQKHHVNSRWPSN